MTEPGSGEKAGIIASLKAAYARWTGAAPKIGTDGVISTAPSALEQGQGVNKKPNLPRGDSGGTTNPFQDSNNKNDEDSSV